MGGIISKAVRWGLSSLIQLFFEKPDLPVDLSETLEQLRQQYGSATDDSDSDSDLPVDLSERVLQQLRQQYGSATEDSDSDSDSTFFPKKDKELEQLQARLREEEQRQSAEVEQQRKQWREEEERKEQQRKQWREEEEQRQRAEAARIEQQTKQWREEKEYWQREEAAQASRMEQQRKQQREEEEQWRREEAERASIIEQQRKEMEELQKEQQVERTREWLRKTELGPGVTEEELMRKAWTVLGMDVVKHYNLAFVGASGAGKSSLINALMGVEDDDPGAAPVGETETTMEIRRYIHPSHPHIVFWDIPGAGTPKHPADTYFLDNMLFAFDCILLLATSRFTDIDFQIATTAIKFKKKFAFLWSKADQGVAAIMRKSKKKTKSEAAKELKQNVIASFKENATRCGVRPEDHKLFVVSAWGLKGDDGIDIDEPDCMRFIFETARQRHTRTRLPASPALLL